MMMARKGCSLRVVAGGHWALWVSAEMNSDYKVIMS